MLLPPTGYSESLPGASSNAENIPDPQKESQEGVVAASQAAVETDTTIFDLYLLEQPVGNIVASFTEDWFEIDNPADVVEQLGDRITGGEAKLQKLCTGRIQKIRKEEGVGTVSIDVNTFRIILAPDPKYLRAGGVKKTNLLPDPEQSLAVQQAMQIASSGPPSDITQSSAFNHRTNVSFGKHYIRAEGTLTQNVGNALLPTGADTDETSGSSYQLTDLYGGTFWGPVQQQAGLLRSQGTQLIGSAEYLGTRFENTDQLFVDQDLIRGSSFQIYVPTRAKVDFFQGSRLLSSQVLNSGLQEVDTSTFPHGSYDVEVVINMPGGGLVRERHFFAKSGLLTVSSRPIVVVEGGRIREGTEMLDRFVYHGGIRWRAFSFLQLEPSLYGTDGRSIGNMNFIGLYRDSTFILSTAYGSDGSRGVAGSLYGSLPLDVRWNLNVQRSNKSDIPESEVQDPRSGFNRTIAITPGLWTWSGRLERAFGPVSLFFVANRSGRKQEIVRRRIGEIPVEEEVQPRFVYGPGLSWTMLTDGRNTLAATASYLLTDEGNGYQAYLAYHRRLSDSWNIDAVAESNTPSRVDTQRVGTQLAYNEAGRADRGLEMRAREDLREEKDPTSGERQGTTSTLESSYASELYKVRGYYYGQHQNNGSSDTTGFQADSSLLYSGGDLSVSYGAGIEAAVAVEVVSRSGLKGQFDVLVDGNRRDTIPAGRTALIPLTPFRTYNVAIQQAKSDKELVQFNAQKLDITVFPGNVIKKTWSAERVYIAIGRVVDEKGAPVAFQRIRGTHEYSVTEIDGSFQIELVGTEDLSVATEKYNCSLKVPKPAGSEEYIVDAGDIVCRSAKEA